MGGVGSGRKPEGGSSGGGIRGNKRKGAHGIVGKNHTPRRHVVSTGVSAEEERLIHEACGARGISISSGVRLMLAYASQGFTDWRALDAPGLQEQFGGGFRHLTNEEREARWKETGSAGQ